MKNYKEQADNLINRLKKYGELTWKIYHEEGNSHKVHLCDSTIEACKERIETLIQAGEYFIDYCEKTDYKCYDEYGDEQDWKIEDCYPLDQELKEIQESINKLKETIK